MIGSKRKAAELKNGRKPTNAKFPAKLRAILEDERFKSIIYWDDEAPGVVLRSPELIAAHVLPEFFNMQAVDSDVLKSFRRQLIYYGFTDVNYKKGATRGERGVSVFVNRDATIRHVTDIDRVLRYTPERKRTAVVSEPSASDSDDDGLGCVRRPTTLQSRQQDLANRLARAQAQARAADAACDALRRENSALRNELSALRVAVGLDAAHFPCDDARQVADDRAACLVLALKEDL